MSNIFKSIHSPYEFLTVRISDENEPKHIIGWIIGLAGQFGVRLNNLRWEDDCLLWENLWDEPKRAKIGSYLLFSEGLLEVVSGFEFDSAYNIVPGTDIDLSDSDEYGSYDQLMALRDEVWWFMCGLVDELEKGGRMGPQYTGRGGELLRWLANEITDLADGAGE